MLQPVVQTAAPVNTCSSIHYNLLSSKELMSLSVCNVKASIRFKTKQKTYSMQKPQLKQKKFVTCMFLITNEIYFIHATVEAANSEQYQVIYSGNLELTAKGFQNSIASYRQYSFLSTTNETHIKSGIGQI